MTRKKPPIAPAPPGARVKLPDEMALWAVSDLVPYVNNSRTHTPQQIDELAAMMLEFGFTNPVLIDVDGGVIAGHGRILAAQQLGMERLPVIQLSHLSAMQRRALVIADNRIAEKAGWDDELLAMELGELADAGFDLAMTGFDEGEVEALFASLDGNGAGAGPDKGHAAQGNAGKTDPDEMPPPAPIVSRRGDVWLLGPHRVMCGDSIVADDVEALVGENTATIVHADPPYGMGKEADGVLNDNLYGHKLDAFQMAWWKAFRIYLVNNGSVYIWGNAPDLWRLWWRSLADTEPMTLRNEIVWDKKRTPGMASADLTQYPEASERCLFIQMGRFVFQVNQTKDDYWHGWEHIRAGLAAERDSAKLTSKRVREITGTHMYGHWFTQSQWAIIDQANYEKLQNSPEALANFAFMQPWSEWRELYDQALAQFRGDVRDPKRAEFNEPRPYFDNAHEAMRDVWEFSRVQGEERFEHATPKPVAMIERCIVSSSRPGDLVLEPFGGTGSTLIAAERSGRRCFMMELDPRYVDTIVRRWQAFTGDAATLDDGQTFDAITARRGSAQTIEETP
jgi:DNA modification methylase